MLWLIPLVFGSLTINPVISQENSKLLLVQALIRHGDRSPFKLYPTDPNTADIWPEGLGKLTMLGKKQHYAVGKFLHSRYQDFITTNPKEVLVNSSAVERCLNSAAANLAGFYAPAGKWKLHEDLNWQPIPIHHLPKDQDKFLSFEGKCPRAESEILKQRYSEEVRDFFKKYQVEIEAISRYSGFNISKEEPFYLYDILEIEKRYNLTIPEWVDLYWEKIKKIHDLFFPIYKISPTGLRLRVGPLLQDIEQNMRKKINGDLPDLKVQMYSTHDFTIGSVLLALNFTNMPQAPYCATLLLELHEMKNSSMAVRMLYLNSTDPLADMGEPNVLQLDDCSDFCPLEFFTSKFQHLIPENWEQECQLDAPDTNKAEKNEIFHAK